MVSIEVVFRLSLFLLSSMGYWFYLRHKGINRYFEVALTASIQIAVLFFAGLLNALSYAQILLFIIGFYFLIISLKRDIACFSYGGVNRNRCPVLFSCIKNRFDIFYIILLVIFLSTVLLTWDKKVYTDDDFHQWALIVKQMLKENRYPSYKDEVIYLTEYAPGSATFIYYFCKIVGEKRESIYFAAQNYLTLAFLFPILGVNKNKSKLLTAFSCAIICSILSLNNSIYNLMVDNIIGIVFVYVVMLCLEGTGCNDKKYKALVPVLITLIIIKNSSIYFIALMIGFIMLSKIDNNKKNAKIKLIASFSPVVAFFLWRRHVNYVFDGGYETHSLTISYFQRIFNGKSLEIRRDICESFFQFAFSGIGFWMILVGLIIAIILAKIYSKKIHIIKVIRITIFLYVSYMTGLLLMYIFSMPLADAIRLASAERYRSTIAITLFYLLSYWFIKEISEKEADNKIKRQMTFAIIGIICLLLFGQIFGVKAPGDSYTRKWLQEKIQEYDIASESSYFVYGTNKDISIYLLFAIIRYDLYSANYSGTPYIENLDSFNEITESYSYIFMLQEPTEETKKWIMDNIPEQYGNDVLVLK